MLSSGDNVSTPNCFDENRPYTSLIALNGSFDLPMPKSASSRDDIVDTASLVVNVEKQSFEVSEESDTYNVKPKEGGKPYTSLIALNGSFDLQMSKIPSASSKNDDSVSMIVNIDKKSKQSSEKTNDVRPRDGDIGTANTTSAKDREVKATSALDEDVNMTTTK